MVRDEGADGVDQRAMLNEDAFRLSGRPRSVDEVGEILRHSRRLRILRALDGDARLLRFKMHDAGGVRGQVGGEPRRGEQQRDARVVEHVAQTFGGIERI